MLSLLLGLILTVSMVCSIPLYTNGILQDMLVKDLEEYQVTTKAYPGKYEVKLDLQQHSLKKPGKKKNAFKILSEEVEGHFASDIGVEMKSQTSALILEHISATKEEFFEKEGSKSEVVKIYGMKGLNSHISLLGGRMPEVGFKDDILECLITPSFQKEHNIILDQVYMIKDFVHKDQGPFKIKPVGVFEQKENNDPWWTKSPKAYNDTFFIDYDFMKNHFILENEALSKCEWYFQVDYTKINIQQLPSLLNTFDNHSDWLEEHSGAKASFKARQILEEYTVRAKTLKITLWVFQVPVLIMLAFYIFMVAQLVVENDKNEISVFKSRGASSMQIFNVYLIQCTILAILAIVIGPLLGLFICKVLGASNGFLELVSRSALPIKMTTDAILYSIIAGIFSIIVMMIPVVSASKISIVELKKKKARKWNAPWWQKLFLDVILLGISLYGLDGYLRDEKIQNLVSVTGEEVPIEPFTFVILTLFILGAGLLFLRIYPYIIKFIYFVGKKIWTPVLYSTFIQVSRSSGREQFLMLFLVFTISIGIFSANSARTINQNTEDRVYYKNGCDVVLKAQWASNKKIDPFGLGIPGATESDEPIIYVEPPYNMISSMTDTVAAAKVFKPNDVSINVGGRCKRGVLMAITPDKFGEVVWKSNNLLPHHINEYLNLLTYAPHAIIVSEEFRKEFGVEAGDSINYKWENNKLIEGVVVAFVKYWPSINPYVNKTSGLFMIANLDYVQAMSKIEPYEVWFKAKEGAKTKNMYNFIEENAITYEYIKVTKQEIIKKKNDPLLQGTNGAMTLGFVVTMAISVVGFIIYWILSIRSRVLQFGIFRAMGMTKANVLSMIAIEQALISIISIIVGIYIGSKSCSLFMQLVQIANTAAQEVPPFKIIYSRADYLKLYSIVGAMIVCGYTLVSVIVSKIKIAQVIKLGED